MIYDVDVALRDLLYREIPLPKKDYDISFEAPDQEWAARLNKPTLNLYLFDLWENKELRGSEQNEEEEDEDGNVSVRRNPVRLDLQYNVTSWAKKIQDEHNLLTAAIVALLRNPFLPEKHLPEVFKNQPTPIRLEVGQQEVLANPTDLWSVLDNNIHPGIRLTVTFTVDPYEPDIYPEVRTAELHFLQTDSPELMEKKEYADMVQAKPSKSFYLVGGRVASEKYSAPLMKLMLVETGQEITLNDDGSFKIRKLQEGEYNLNVLVNERVVKRQKISVPSERYEIEV